MNIECTHASMHACLCMYAHKHTRAQSLTDEYIFVCLFTYAFTHTHLYIRMHVYVRACSSQLPCNPGLRPLLPLRRRSGSGSASARRNYKRPKGLQYRVATMIPLTLQRCSAKRCCHQCSKGRQPFDPRFPFKPNPRIPSGGIPLRDLLHPSRFLYMYMSLYAGWFILYSHSQCVRSHTLLGLRDRVGQALHGPLCLALTLWNHKPGLGRGRTATLARVAVRRRRRRRRIYLQSTVD